MAFGYTWTSPYVGDDYNNTLVGSFGHDEIYGYGGEDTIVGDYGEDYIDGNNGSDLLAGGSLGGIFDPEPDIFVFDLDDGNDTITDFTPPCYGCPYPSPGDQIMLLGGTPNDVGVILASATTTVTGQTILAYGNTTIGLNGIDESEVSQDWFLLA